MIIYKIINLLNNKVYIGQTNRNLEQRWKEHKQESNDNNIYLYNSMRKYGIENFKIEELLKCYSQEDLDFFEDYYIVVLNTMNTERGYNCKRGGSHGKLSEEIRIKISKTLKGMNVGKNNPMYGKYHSEETIQKMKEGWKKYNEKKRQKYEKIKQENNFPKMRYWDLYNKARELNIFSRAKMSKQVLIELFMNNEVIENV